MLANEANWRRRIVGVGGALLLGTLAGWLAIGSPRAILRGDLLVPSDYANAAAAFRFFTRDEWHWPLGANPLFGGVNIFFSDGAPWFALLGKSLNSLALPSPSFHALVFLNFLLFALFALKLAKTLSREPRTQWLVTGLLVFCLIMPVRLLGAQHIALSSHWVLLWAMSAVPLLEERETVAWRRWEFLAPLAFATWSHAYLAAMTAVILLVFLLARRRLVAVATVFVLPTVLLWSIGAFGGFDTRLEGAKAFGLDVLALAQSLGWGISPQLYPLVEAQGDSFIFLGTGAWLALIFGSICFVASAECRQNVREGLNQPRLKLLLLAGLALYAFGMVLSIRVAGDVWFSIPTPEPLQALYGRFRAAGRFGTPLAYALIVLSGLAAALCIRRPTPALLLAILVLSLQAADLVRAGYQAPGDGQRNDLRIAREQVATLLAGGRWGGRVFREIRTDADLEKQQVLDYLLTEAGAQEFRLVHSARRDPAAIAAREGKQDAKSGDLLIYPASVPSQTCQRHTRWGDFELCLL